MAPSKPATGKPRAARRRRFGEIDRRTSGNYRARSPGPDGARHSGPHTFETKEAAEAWLSEERKRIDWGQWVSPAERAERERAEAEAAEAEAGRTLEAAYERYLEWRTKPLAASTLTDYGKTWRLYIAPYWGAGRAVGTITNDDVWQWRRGPLARGARKDHGALALFKAVMRKAQAWGWIERDPTAGVAMTRKRTPVAERQAFTVEEVRRYLEAAEPDAVAVLATVALAGLRSGEVRALRRADIDLPGRQLHVRRAVDFGRDAEGGYTKSVKTPKTGAGKRTVPFGETLEGILREHLRLHPALPGGLVFPGHDGGIMGTAALERRHYRTLENLGLRVPEAELRRLRRRGEPVPQQPKAPRLHDLRASYAAWLFEAGYSIPEVMALGGWADSRMPLEVYSRVFPARVAEVGHRQDEALGTLDVEVG